MREAENGMLFQSFTFLIFFAVTVGLTFLLRGKAQRWVLLAASLFFYAYGSAAHLFLLLFVILVTWGAARIVERNHSRAVYVAALVLSFIPLLVCKYVPFFGSEFFPQHAALLKKIPLPIGVSFFTFQAVSYLVDVWRGRMKAERNFFTYALFVSFFPQLVAGPIERAEALLDQIKREHRFEYKNAAEGLLQMGIGLVLKLFIADRLAYIADLAYTGPVDHSGLFMLLATMLFGFQIYCDFNGYTIIARGAAQVLGVRLMENFRRPYFAVSCTDFWRRWHISLSSWFRDYVYIPLGGNRKGKLRCCGNLLVTFTLSGLWHGANWTYLVWGALNGVYQAGEKLLGLGGERKTRAGKAFGWIVTYLLITLSWVFFRADDMAQAMDALRAIFGIPRELRGFLAGQISFGALIPTGGMFLWNAALSVLGLVLLLGYSLYEERGNSLVRSIRALKPVWRYLIYALLLLAPVCFGKFASGGAFIYFRF